MIESRMIGDIKVTRIYEYAGPTHDLSFIPKPTPVFLKSMKTP